MSVAEDTLPETKMHPDNDPWEMDLKDIDMSQGIIFKHNKHHEYFKRLRQEAPVHFNDQNPEIEGGFWSITRYKDIMAIDTNWRTFSNEPQIVLGQQEEDFELEMFIAMDPPKHDIQRKVVSPAVNPHRLSDLEGLIRERTAEVLDSLPVGEQFDWVDKVSIELTTRMLATLFDFPFEDRRKLTYWSDIATAGPVNELGISEEKRKEDLFECLNTFVDMFQTRKQQPPAEDFISLLAHNPQTKDMNGLELLGNLILLIVGGNDTTRNSMSAGVEFLNENPAEYEKLRKDPSLIPNMVSEIIRFKTPLAYMRRTAQEDIELHGQKIKKGDQIAMWYVSGNRDEAEIPDPDKFLIDRPNARHHMSFGYGVHRCMGNRVAEAQLRILWEEVIKRFDFVEVVGEPQRLLHSFVMGVTELPVILHPKK